MIDKKYIGCKSSPHIVEIEKGRLRFFSKAIGETNPIYTDEAAAKAAGYRSLPAPPTFYFSLDLERSRPFGEVEDMGLKFGSFLHGEQAFTYYEPICAGDTITILSYVADIYEKKNGLLEFIVEEYTFTNQLSKLVAEMRRTLVVRH